MRVVVGLGNPGIRYARTRHNVGFAVVEELERRWGWLLGPVGAGLRLAVGRRGDESVMLVEPQMYMNLSGEALTALEPPVQARDLVVVHDDLDLCAGRIRVKCGGGTAGHRGVNSIATDFGPDFTRVRLGVGRPPQGMDPSDFVLSVCEPEEWEAIGAVVQRAGDAVECLLHEGAEVAMNRFNGPSAART